MKIIYKPFEEIFYVMYNNPIVYFNFQDQNTSIIYDADCYQLKGKISKERNGRGFNITSDIPGGKYTFLCLMTSYNYNDTITIIIENALQNGNIIPPGGILSYKNKGLITCDSTNKALVKYLEIYVKRIDLNYTTKVNKRQIQLNWDLSLKNKEICFFCKAGQKQLAEECYQLQINISFKLTPYISIYFMKTLEHQIYARFYDEFTSENISSNCEYPQNPLLFPQIGIYVTLKPIIPVGVYKIFCSPENIKLKEPFTVTIKHELSLMILPDITILSTYSDYTIICKAKTYVNLTDTGLNFKAFYPRNYAYNKTSDMSYIIKSRINFHNTSICFKCFIDIIQAFRCYKWLGNIEFHRSPIKKKYFIYIDNVIKTYYINKNEPYVNVIAECSTITGPGTIFQDKNFYIIIRSLSIGLYYVMCKMDNINQYDFFNLKIETPIKSILKSNFYPNIYNASHTLLFPGEEITISLSYPNYFSFIVYGWVHYNSINLIIKSISERLEKNKVLLINKKKLTIPRESNKYGYDYMIYCHYSFYDLSLKSVMNYTIGSGPNNIQINSSFYIIYYEKINYVSNGFPTELMFYNIKLDENLICKHTQLKICKIPIVENFGMTRLKVTSILEQLSYVKFAYTAVKIISISAFKKFQWKEENKIIYYKNDIVTCEVNLITPYYISIVKLSGESEIKSTFSNKLILPNLMFGEYKLACVLLIKNFNTEFLRVKVIQIYNNFTDICFFSFAPVSHMLVKCATVQFPKRKYSILCKYTFDGKERNISKEFLLNSEFLVPIINKNSSCITYEKIPDEYRYVFKNDVLSFNYLYYLDDINSRKDLHYISLLFTLFILFIILIPVIPLMMRLRKLSDTEEIRQLTEQNTYNLRRLKIRRMNDKFINILKFLAFQTVSEETRTYETYNALKHY